MQPGVYHAALRHPLLQQAHWVPAVGSVSAESCCLRLTGAAASEANCCRRRQGPRSAAASWAGPAA